MCSTQPCFNSMEQPQAEAICEMMMIFMKKRMSQALPGVIRPRASKGDPAASSAAADAAADAPPRQRTRRERPGASEMMMDAETTDRVAAKKREADEDLTENGEGQQNKPNTETASTGAASTTPAVGQLATIVKQQEELQK